MCYFSFFLNKLKSVLCNLFRFSGGGGGDHTGDVKVSKTLEKLFVLNIIH